MLFCVSHTTRICCFYSNQIVNKCRRRIRVVRLTQNSYIIWIFSKMVLRWRRGDKLLNKFIILVCIQKVFSSLHNIQIEPLMADGLFWRFFSYFSRPWQWNLVCSLTNLQLSYQSNQSYFPDLTWANLPFCSWSSYDQSWRKQMKWYTF